MLLTAGTSPNCLLTLRNSMLIFRSGGAFVKSIAAPGLHYNIQIHLPATKDVEVYNAIFKSLKEHLIG